MVMTSDTLGDAITAALLPLVKAMVEHPDDVRIECNCSPNKTMFVSLFVKKEDRGVVIGREGKTAYAMRTLLSNICGRYQHRSILEIVE